MWKDFIYWIQHDGLYIVLILVVSALIAQIGVKLLGSIVRRTVGRIKTDISEDDVKKRQDTITSMFGTMIRVLVWVTAGFSVLRRIGIDPAPLIASAGILGVALGFGSQSLVKDMLSGLFIIIENQYRVGDVVDIEGAAGTVEQITIRSTVIRDIEGNVHYLPNGSVLHVINKTMGFSKVSFSVKVTADTNVDTLTAVINEVGAKLAADEKWKDKVLEPPHFINIGAMTDTTIEARIVGKTPPSKQWTVTSEMRKRLLAAFKKHNVQMVEMPGTTTVPKKK